MESTLVSTADGALELPCGCRTEYVNNKHINILCDLHEEEYQELLEAPIHYKKTKMRDSREI